MTRTTSTTATRPEPTAEDLATLAPQLAAAEAERERLQAEALTLAAILPEGAGLPRSGVTAVEVIRARQRRPTLRAEQDSNYVRVAELTARVTAARAIAHAQIRADFLPRKRAAAERALLAGRAFADAMLALLTLEHDEADQLGDRYPSEAGTSLVLGGWAPSTPMRESVLDNWERQARAAGLLA